MNEIEIKAKLRDKEKLLEHIKNAGAEYIETKHQKDVAYWPNSIKTIGDGKKLLGVNYLRIRKQNSKKINKTIFTLKQPQINQADCKEIEIEINEEDISKLESIISTLGFYEFCTIEKDRDIYKINDIEICIDEVSGLGSYIELEKFGNSGDAEKIQSELSKMLESWGVKKEDQTTDGYDILIHNLEK